MIKRLLVTLFVIGAVVMALALLPYWLGPFFVISVGGGIGVLIGSMSESGRRIDQPFRAFMLAIVLVAVWFMRPGFEYFGRTTNEDLRDVFNYPVLFPDSILWWLGMMALFLGFCCFEGLLPGEEEPQISQPELPSSKDSVSTT